MNYINYSNTILTFVCLSLTIILCFFKGTRYTWLKALIGYLCWVNRPSLPSCALLVGIAAAETHSMRVGAVNKMFVSP